jgi:hypothetical protein
MKLIYLKEYLHRMRNKVMNNNWFAPTSIQKLSNAEVVVFPNPANQLITISGLKQYKQIDMYDLYGRKVLSVHNSRTLNTENLSPGQYILRIYDGNDHIHHRSVVVSR